jgi:hypothetical protein
MEIKPATLVAYYVPTGSHGSSAAKSTCKIEGAYVLIIDSRPVE